jgi:hypothetical protein
MKISDRKFYRQNTCEAHLKIEVSALKKSDLNIILTRYTNIRKYMERLAHEKQRYYKSLLAMVIKKYEDVTM